MFQRNRTLLRICTLLLIIGLFLLVTFEREPKLRVTVIDGVPLSHFSFYVKKINYEKGDNEIVIHSNIVWGLLSKDLDVSKINFSEYSVMGKNGQINTATLTRALKQAQKNDTDVINLLGGFYLEDEEVKEQVQSLSKKGVIIVAAGGDNYQGIADFPVRMPDAISVGSKKRENISPLSAIDKIDIYENGGEILYDGKTYSGAPFATSKVTNKILREYFRTKNLGRIKGNILKKEN